MSRTRRWKQQDNTIGQQALLLLLTTLPVNFCAKGKLVTVKTFVIGGETLPETLNKYFPMMFCTKSPFWKFNFAVIVPLAEPSVSPATLKFVTPPMTWPAWPSVMLNCCTSKSAASMTPLVLESRNFWTTTDPPGVRPVICNVIVPV